MLKQTLIIPNTTTHLSVELSEPIPAGTATFWIDWAVPPPKPQKVSAAETIEVPNVFDQAARLNGYEDHADYLRSNTPATLEEAEAEAERKFNDPKNKNWFDKYYGILAGDEAYGDGMEYQRKMRDEWNHRG